MEINFNIKKILCFYTQSVKRFVLFCVSPILSQHRTLSDMTASGDLGSHPALMSWNIKLEKYLGMILPRDMWTWDMCGRGTAVAPCNWTPWRLRHLWAAPQRFHSQENIQQSAQMRHLSKHFCCQIFNSIEFTLSLTSILWQSVWIKSCEIGQGVFFIQISWHLNRNLWQMYHL